jgi:hypothetical protein
VLGLKPKAFFISNPKQQVTEIVHRAVGLHGGSPKSHLALAWWHYHGDPVFFPTNEMAKLVRDAASEAS